MTDSWTERVSSPDLPGCVDILSALKSIGQTVTQLPLPMIRQGFPNSRSLHAAQYDHPNPDHNHPTPPGHKASTRRTHVGGLGGRWESRYESG